MQRVSPTSTIWRTIASKSKKLFSLNDPFARSFSMVPVVATVAKKPHQPKILSDFLKWGSIGFCRTSRFASRFNPLQLKLLDSIVNVHRLKDRYPEEIPSTWDDFFSYNSWSTMSVNSSTRGNTASNRLCYCGEELPFEQQRCQGIMEDCSTPVNYHNKMQIDVIFFHVDEDIDVGATKISRIEPIPDLV